VKPLSPGTVLGTSHPERMRRATAKVLSFVSVLAGMGFGR
jgi:hypothetical protein